MTIDPGHAYHGTEDEATRHSEPAWFMQQIEANKAVFAAMAAGMMSTPTAMVLLVLISHARTSGAVWPSVNTIAAESALSRRKAQYCLRELVSLGAIAVIERGGLKGQRRSATTYAVRWDALADLRLQF